MMTLSPKDLVRRFIDTMPEGLSVEEIAYRIAFEEKLRKARLNAKKNEVYTQEEADAILESWISKHPR